MFELIPAIIGFIAGLGCIAFPAKVVSMNKRTSAKHNDSVNNYIANYPEKDGRKLVVFIGLMLIVISLLKILTFFGVVDLNQIF